MTRRRVVLYVSLGLVLALVLTVGIGVLVLTRSGWGQDKVRTLIQNQLAGAVHGHVYVGRITGSYLTDLTIDSLEIRDAEDSLFVATGPVTVAYDVRDILDKRLLFSRADIVRPTVYLRQHEDWDWNFRQIFRQGPDTKPAAADSGRGAIARSLPHPKAPGPAWGDFVVLDSVTVHDASFELTQPWHPDDSLHGARRDSAINAALKNPDVEIRRRRDGLARTRRWTSINGALSHVRVNDPDSAGRLFVIDHLNADEQDPPFVFHNVAGTVRNQGDSVWLQVSHFDLPRSTGSGSGKVVWGSNLPVRYDLHIIGDSVSLADVDWVYPTLPTTGGGSVVLDIKNERNLDVVDYKLTKLNVVSTRSHLRGAMTFAVGGPVLQVKDVDLQADPVDFDLLRTFNGKPLPVDWQGKISGMVVARGGPLTDFVVDSSHLVFHDAHVDGAVSEMSGRGGLNILQPALTEFHHFNVAARTLDLRTVEYLYPNFPRLTGSLSGSATLDSSWLDVRFSNADVRYHDADAPVSRLQGYGRVTYGTQYMTYDASLLADSLSLDALRRSYPKLPVIGMYAGSIRTQGTIADLSVEATLHGPAGAFSYSGRLDVDTPSVAAHGSGRLVGVDPARALAADSMPSGSLTGNYQLDVTGDSIADLEGLASLSLERSEFDHVQIFNSRSHLRFGAGRVHVDTLDVQTSAASLKAHGALGLHAGIEDTLVYSVVVDSLGGLRPFLATRNAVKTGTRDSLAGQFELDSGVVAGNLATLSVAGYGGVGRDLYINKDRGATVMLSFAFDDVLRAPRGVASLKLDTLVVGGVRVDTIGVSANLSRATTRAEGGMQFSGTYSVGVLSDNGPTFSLGGTISHAAGRTAVGVDSGAVRVGDDQWHLARRGLVTIDPALTSIDTLRMVNAHGGVVSIAGVVPEQDSVALRIRADSIPVRDVATLLQVRDSMAGWGSLHADVAGTRDAPLIMVDANAQQLTYGSMTLQRVLASARYLNRRTDATFNILRGGIPTLQATASLPMELELYGGRLLDDSLGGTIRADSADFAIVEALVPTISKAKGRLLLNLDVGGTWKHPTLNGLVDMHDGEFALADAGITLHGVNAKLTVSGTNDSLAVRELRAWSGDSPSNYLAFDTTSYIKFRDRTNPMFNLRMRAHEFRVVDKRTLARLDVSTGSDLVLAGREKGSTLTGALNIVRGTVYIPERDLAKKQMVQLSYADLQEIGDTISYNNRINLPSPPSALLKDMTINVPVTLGDEVWLRSQEVNIKFGGALNVVQRASQRSVAASQAFAAGGGAAAPDSLNYQLALDGTLTAERGTYTLSLGPIQREFQVQSGTITFYGDLNPRIEITAQYVVRQTNRPDVTVNATLTGYLYPGPSLDLQSGENYSIPQSDLVSYLCCGVPSYELGANQTYLQTAAQVLLPTASSVLAHTLRGQLGSTFDILQFQPGATDEATAKGQSTTSAARQFFSGARLGGDRQITNNLYFSISTGLCQLAPSQQSGAGSGGFSFVEQLESKLQYRFTPTLSAEVGLEPPSSALLCGRAPRGLVPTPQQWGLSLSKTWRW
jgi:translocation and assembly module TamB